MHSTSSISSTALHAGLHAFLPSSSIVSTQQPCQQPTQEVQRSVRAKFILKLHSIITLPNAEIIQWSSDGRSFTIKHPALFQEQLLSEIFSHNTYASFERQLHFYSFKRMGEHETVPTRKRFKKGAAIKYNHPMFCRDSTQECLMNIVRRTTPTQQRKALVKELKKARKEASQNTLQYTRLQHVYQALQEEIANHQTAARDNAQAEAQAKDEDEQEQEPQRKKARIIVVTPPATQPDVSALNGDTLLNRVDSLDWDETMKMLDATSDEILQYGSSFNPDDDTNDVTNNMFDDYITSDYNA